MAKYKFWSDAEISEIKAGHIPEGRQYGDCLQKAHNMGITFHKSDRKNGWTPEQIEMVKKGILPKGKTFSAVSGYCKTILGFSFHQVHKDTPWTDDELECLRNGKKPESRTVREYKIKQAELSVASLGNAGVPDTTDDRAQRGKTFFDLTMQGLSLRTIGKQFNISGERVRQLVNLYKSYIKE